MDRQNLPFICLASLALAFTISTTIAQPGQGKPPPGHAANDPELGTFLAGDVSSGGYAVDVSCDKKCWGADYDDRGGRRNPLGGHGVHLLQHQVGVAESNIRHRLAAGLNTVKGSAGEEGVSLSINPRTRIVFPHLANGKDPGLSVATSLTLSNVQPEPITVILKVFDSAGALLTVDLLDRISGKLLTPVHDGFYHVPIEPFQTAFLKTSGTGPLKLGWASAWAVCSNPLFCDQATTYQIGGNSVFEVTDESTGEIQSIVGVGASGASPAFCVPVVKESPSFTNTAIALANNSNTTACFRVYLIGANGDVDSTTITLDPGEHAAQFVDELFPGIGSRYYGTLHFFQVDESGEIDPRFNIHTISLLVTKGILTSVPVTNMFSFAEPPEHSGWDPDRSDRFFNGSWSGTTGQGRPLKFEVEQNRVTKVTLDVLVQGSGCTVTISGGLGIDPGFEIVNDAFTWTFKDSTRSITLKGTFDSTTAARGTLTVTMSGNCPGTAETTWTAKRN
jgi:hypothetical protein